MSLTVSPDLIASTKSPLLESYRQDAGRADRDQVIDTAKLNDEGMSDLINAAQSVQDNKTARALESILLARAGKFDKPVPNFKAFQAKTKTHGRFIFTVRAFIFGAGDRS